MVRGGNAYAAGDTERELGCPATARLCKASKEASCRNAVLAVINNRREGRDHVGALRMA